MARTDGRFQYEDAHLAERKGNDFLIVWKLKDGTFEVEHRWTKNGGSVNEVWGQTFKHFDQKRPPCRKDKSLFDQFNIWY